MGYWQSINDHCFSIPKDKIQAIFAEAQMEGSGISEAYYSTAMPSQKSILTLDNWELKIYPDKDVVTDLLLDCDRSCDSDEAVMALIAKYNTEDGAFVWMDGEGHDQWKWFFIGGKAVMVWPEIYWPEPEVRK